ncbi:unnamed protein product [Nippostrongylus brasiliensis]|uniref:Cation transporter n=1 Tax=Nippostrongylus brasiliensis TaxID=27835 RepID=A0A0N4XYQ1_NIPBR|nr:unnamed protein product [Nippostrongylus brasiliensis]
MSSGCCESAGDHPTIARSDSSGIMVEKSRHHL